MLRAIDAPTIDHRGPEFAALGKTVIAGMKKVFKTDGDGGHLSGVGNGRMGGGARQHALAGDRVLMVETGHFATLWQKLAERLGLAVEFLPGDWRHGAVAAGDRGASSPRTRQHAIKAVCVVHNETSTGVTSRVADVRAAIDRARHPALFMVDTISSLASIDYRHDEWGVDVTVAGSQKGLMLPPGLSFNAISDKALAAASTRSCRARTGAGTRCSRSTRQGYFPYTPATNLLVRPAEALEMLLEEGLDNVFARHERHAEATRRAVRAWGLEILCADPARVQLDR